MQQILRQSLGQAGFLHRFAEAGERTQQQDHVPTDGSLQFPGSQAAGGHHHHHCQKNSGHQVEHFEQRQDDHQGCHQNRHPFAVGGGHVLFQFVQQHQIVVGLQAANGIEGRLQ